MGSLQYLLLVFTTAILCQSTVYGRALPETKVHQSKGLERRDQVDLCQAALVALKASAFCSSFNKISDVTKTVPYTGSAASTTLTVTGASCTTTGSPITITKTNSVSGPTSSVTTTVVLPAATSTLSSNLAASTVFETTTSAVTVTNSAVTTGPVVTATSTVLITASTSITTTSTTTATVTTSTTIPFNKRDVSPRCSIKGLPTQVGSFACDIISKACSRYVQPRTSTVSSTIAGATLTATTTVSASCATVTPTSTTTVFNTDSAVSTTTTVTNTPSAVTTTVYNQLSAITSQVTVTNSVTVGSTSVITPTTTITTTMTDRTVTATSTVLTTATATTTVCPQTTRIISDPNNSYVKFTEYTCTQCRTNGYIGKLANSPNFDTCMGHCFDDPNCITVSYQRSTGNCEAYIGVYYQNNPTPNSDYICAAYNP